MQYIFYAFIFPLLETNARRLHDAVLHILEQRKGMKPKEMRVNKSGRRRRSRRGTRQQIRLGNFKARMVNFLLKNKDDVAADSARELDDQPSWKSYDGSFSYIQEEEKRIQRKVTIRLPALHLRHFLAK